ncbi:unnamed protein product [Gongylonema pulchrum]|uniref:SERRATE/Ars2 N-terminal domain-containing protein n=1 Tax=Gongylonema pulchrum TaxID=637853 RepID=A0A3P6SLX6_9BILA|nr:unnamed protein product [Gongylonema pulchrum]
MKYHPEDSRERKSQQAQNIARRLEIFQSLYDEKIKDLHIDYDCAAEIIRTMDTCWFMCL